MSRRILVIDDNQEILTLFHDLLTVEQYEVILSDFVGAGQVGQLQPDLLILDYFSGYEPVGGQLIQQLKLQPTTKHIPIIVCTTASTAKAQKEPAFLAQGVHVVFKPFDVAELMQKIEQAFLDRDGQTEVIAA